MFVVSSCVETELKPTKTCKHFTGAPLSFQVTSGWKQVSLSNHREGRGSYFGGGTHCAAVLGKAQCGEELLGGGQLGPGHWDILPWKWWFHLIEPYEQMNTEVGTVTTYCQTGGSPQTSGLNHSLLGGVMRFLTKPPKSGYIPKCWPWVGNWGTRQYANESDRDLLLCDCGNLRWLLWYLNLLMYPPVNSHNYGKSPLLIGKSININDIWAPFSIAMLDYHRVDGDLGTSQFLRGI